jgi:hypothetical protein
MRAAKKAKGEHLRVAACGECAPQLWAQGNRKRRFGRNGCGIGVAKKYDVAILCGYPLGSFQGGVGSHIFEKICAEHSAVHRSEKNHSGAPKSHAAAALASRSNSVSGMVHSLNPQTRQTVILGNMKTASLSRPSRPGITAPNWLYYLSRTTCMT